MDVRQTGSFIAELRAEQGLTQAQLAEKLLVSDKAISRWETGRGAPDIDNLEALARTLDVSVAELLHGKRMEETLSSEEANELTGDALNLVRELSQRRSVMAVVLGFLAGIIVVALSVVHLMSPIAIPYSQAKPLRIEVLDDGTLLAVANGPIAGMKVDRITLSEGIEIHISAYTTRLTQLQGPSEDSQTTWVLGKVDDTDSVYYYPGSGTTPFHPDVPEDVLLWAKDTRVRDHVSTLPRRLFNFWIFVGAIASILAFLAGRLLHKRWYAPHILKAALLFACFTLAAIAVLWGKFNQVYNASFYASGICLVGVALWVLALVIVKRNTAVSHQV